MPLPPPSPDDTCLVTGASSGLGAGIARALARRGHALTLVGRDEDALREVAASVAVPAEVFACDLADAAARARLVEDVAARGRRVGILVNDAGVAPFGPVHERDPADEVAHVRVNAEAVVDLTTRLTPGMVAQGAGGVLNLASIAAFAPTPHQATYGATKAFVLSYTDAIGAELAPRGVHVTALCPGPVPTGIFRGAPAHPVDRAPRFLWREAPPVAETGVRALERGRARAFAGFPNRAAAVLEQHAPRWRPGLSLFARWFTPPERPNPARR